MKKADSIVCKTLLERCTPEKKAAYSRYLSEEERHFIDALPPLFSDPVKESSVTEEQLDAIHPSWFAPFLRTLPESDIRLFISCLNERSSKELAKILLYSPSYVVLTPLARLFLQKTLLEKIAEGQEILPPSYLPKSPMNVLLTMSRPQLLALIDFLGMHDLSFEIRQIIDTTKLRQINQCLTKDEQAYLKQLLQQQEPLAFKKMGLERWRGDSSTLRTLLQQRGLNRLGKALFNQDPSLLWYTSHRLDFEKGNALVQLSTDVGSPKAATFLQEQVVMLSAHIQHLTSEEKP